MPSNGSTGQRGYGHQHQARRLQYTQAMQAGHIYPCRRCGNPITPTQAWDLGHDDDDRDNIPSEPEHRHAKDCPAGGNRATAGRRTTEQPAALGFFTT